MGIQWILDPQNKLFSTISSYERFLLYLNFKEGLGVRQIAEKLGRAKNTIHTHITEALEKLRRAHERERKGGIEHAIWESTRKLGEDTG